MRRDGEEEEVVEVLSLFLFYLIFEPVGPAL